MMCSGVYKELLAKNKKAVEPGEFPIAAVALDHPHIYGMVSALVAAGATLRWIYDSDYEKAAAMAAQYPGAKAARSEAEVLEDPRIALVASAAIPAQRCALGLRVMAAGKDYFTDKAPMTSLKQLDQVREAVSRTGRKYMVYYSERLHSESGVHAGELVRDGAIGKVIQVMGLGPHRLNADTRPPWFFDRAQYGGILCDIGSHQIEQFLYYTGSQEAQITAAQIGNLAHPQYPELEDFGDAMLLGDKGATGYFRVDWFTPDGLRTWGDGRTLIVGTEGYIELRKYIDVGTGQEGDVVILVDGIRERKYSVRGRIGYPFFGQLILDCLNRTEYAMTQRHALKAAELCLRAEAAARRIKLS